MYIHTYVYTYIHTYVYIYVYTYIHTFSGEGQMTLGRSALSILCLYHRHLSVPNTFTAQRRRRGGGWRGGRGGGTGERGRGEGGGVEDEGQGGGGGIGGGGLCGTLAEIDAVLNPTVRKRSNCAAFCA